MCVWVCVCAYIYIYIYVCVCVCVCGCVWMCCRRVQYLQAGNMSNQKVAKLSHNHETKTTHIYKCSFYSCRIICWNMLNRYLSIYLHTHTHIYIYIYIYIYRHQVMLIAQIPLTSSHFPFPSSIALDISFCYRDYQHRTGGYKSLLKSQHWCVRVWESRKKKSFMSLPLLYYVLFI